MGKLPSFQFYPGDWLKDPQLRMASMSSKGIWIDLLCSMFESHERGALEATADQFCKLLGCSREEFDLFLSEARSLSFANVREVSADCPPVIRIESRRMLRDEKKRQVWTKQKANQRKQSEASDDSDGCPPNVHPDVHEMSRLSSSSSSSSKKDTPLPPKEGASFLISGISRKPESQKKKNSRTELSPEFELVYGLYPKRPAGDSKIAAYKAWNARVAAGVTPAEMRAGVERYAKFVFEAGTSGTNFIKTASVFFGPNEFWKQPWEAGNSNGATNGKVRSALMSAANYQSQVDRSER